MNEENNNARSNDLKRAEIVEVIRTQRIEGTGLTENDPVCRVVEFWTKDGVLIASRSSANEDIIPFTHS